MASQKNTILIFISVLFLFAVIYLFLWLYQAYAGGTGYAERTTESTIECMGYIFEVNNINYANNSLSFNLYNRKASNTLQTIILKTSTTEIPINVSLEPDSTQTITETIQITDEFFIFPKRCEIYKKSYSIT